MNETKIWPPEHIKPLRLFSLMAPFLIARDPLNPTPEDWARYQSIVDNAQWN